MEDLYRMLRNGHIEAQGIVDTMDAPIAVLNEQLCVINVNRAFYDVFKVDRAETIGSSLFELGSGQWDAAELRLLLSNIIPRSAAIVGYEVEHDFPGIGHRTMLVSARRLRGAGTGTRSIMLQFEDVTQRREQDAAQNLLLAETRHRAQNLFAVARALASETEAEGLTGAEYRDAFLGRFEALLKGQSLQEDFSTADFRKIAERTLEPFAARVRMGGGPAVLLGAGQILPMVLVLHELMTNAAKHGALSTPQGEIRLSWELKAGSSGATLEVHWEEAGGPPVSQVGRRGFGSRLMQFGVAKGLNGVMSFNFEPEGLRVSLSLPVP